MEPYKVKYMNDTVDIINHALEGTKEFILPSDDVNDILKKYDLDYKDNEINNLLTSGTYEDWWKLANDSKFKYSKQLKSFLKTFVDKMEILKDRNKALYSSMIKLFNPNISDDNVMSFKFPEINDNNELEAN